jgi:glycerol kinase
MACENLELLSARGPLDRVRVAGGLSMLDGACQRLADLSRARIWRGAEVEGTARGLARVLFDGRAKETAPKGRWFEPREHPALVERRAAWRAAMAAALA